MKQNTWKKWIGIAVAVVIVLVVAAGIAVFALRIDPAEAQQIALDTAGGGEVVAQEVSNEGLWNEYEYTIVNGDKWYNISINGFGFIEEMEQGTGQYSGR